MKETETIFMEIKLRRERKTIFSLMSPVKGGPPSQHV